MENASIHLGVAENNGQKSNMELFDSNVLSRIGEHLLKKNESVAVAESVTAGLIQFALSNIIDAAKLFQGGIIAYNLGQKCKHLGVDPLHAMQVNCVSQEIAQQMATQTISNFSVQWGIAITGYASPVPESDNKVFAYYSIVHKSKVKAEGMLKCHDMTPPQAQHFYVSRLLELFSDLLYKK